MAAQSTPDGYILGIDYGEARVGLALASPIAKLPSPYKILANTGEQLISDIAEIAAMEQVKVIVVGLPRNQSGEETAQTLKVREFADRLGASTPVKITFADESLSSIRAEEMRKELKDRPAGSPIDDLAACFILEEFLKELG